MLLIPSAIGLTKIPSIKNCQILVLLFLRFRFRGIVELYSTNIERCVQKGLEVSHN